MSRYPPPGYRCQELVSQSQTQPALKAAVDVGKQLGRQPRSQHPQSMMSKYPPSPYDDCDFDDPVVEKVKGSDDPNLAGAGSVTPPMVSKCDVAKQPSPQPWDLAPVTWTVRKVGPIWPKSDSCGRETWWQTYEKTFSDGGRAEWFDKQVKQ